MKRPSKAQRTKPTRTKKSSIDEFQQAPTYDTANPLEVTEVFWLHAERRKGRYPESTPRAGKWLVFVPLNSLDDVWSKIKLATEEGRLGGSSKVGTARPNPNATNPNSRVICVYTYDWKDEKDVRRVREELRKLGIIAKIPYKSDEDTLSGKYRITGHTRISKYYE
jgi:hypothetical protein